MNIKDLSQSRYLKKEEVEDGVIATIDRVVEENTAPEGQKPEMAWIMYFKELEKPLWLKPTTGAQLASICGSDESDDWIGHRVELYNDMGVTFNGARGGIRVRKAHGSPAATKRSADPVADAKSVAIEVFGVFKKTLRDGTTPAQAKEMMLAVAVDFFGAGVTLASLTADQWRKMADAHFHPPLPATGEIDPSDVPF